MPAERIRVHIAGNIHPHRGVVRRFLEDDGYDVIGQTTSRKTLLAAIRSKEPDAIVVDDELLSGGPGGGTLARIRAATPDAKVIVFTTSPPSQATEPLGADGYLQKGVSLAALTSLLGRLFADETARLEPAAAGAGVAAAAIAASAPPADLGRRAKEPVGAAANGNSAATARAVAIAGGAILIVWGMIAMLATGGGPTPPPADRTDRGGVEVLGDTSLDEAYASLRRLMTAAESGNYVLAGIEAEALMAARAEAAGDGFALIGLDAEVTARLGTIVDLLPLRVNTTLSAILGSLYPVLPDEEVPGGGSGIVFGPVFTGGTSGGTTGQEDGAGVVVVVDVGEGPGGDAGEGPTLGPGDGRAWGQSHGEPHVFAGLPPWSNGRAEAHANGLALGHGKGLAVGHSNDRAVGRG